MTQQTVVIIDTGCANVSSVKFAVERLGYRVTVSRDAEVVLAADKLFLPGVGSAREAMKNLQERDLVSLVKQVKQPLLGICLGMQLLSLRSQEKPLAEQDSSDSVDCIGLCNGEVKLMQTGDLPLPHMGWNTVNAQPEHPLFKDIDSDEYFYFVHSYAMPVGDYTVASCEYGNAFSAVIQSGNFYGVQFHPERSSKAGAKLIRNFLEL